MWKSLDQLVDEMRATAEQLVLHTYPMVEPGVDADVSILKMREAVVDGYSVYLFFSRACYPEFYIETLHVYGRYCWFLPFPLVCKLAKTFLGGHELFLQEQMRGANDERRKVYCWTVAVDDAGHPRSLTKQKKLEHCQFEGLKYDYMSPEVSKARKP